MKRTSSKRFYLYIVFVLAVLVMSWEQSQNHTALASTSIPEESIRLRILANSDSASDQWIKRQVRDAITEQINVWVTEPDTIQDARVLIQSRMPEIEQRISEVLTKHGYNYAFKVDLGQVEFPTKMYGNRVYPAGEYEALRVVLGQGEGQNWWCVLFPPLCFVDLASGEAVAAETEDSQADPADESDKPNEQQKPDEQSEAQEGLTALADISSSEGPEVKFFLWELLQDLTSWLKGLFA
jgi:stage II sporulation protein R